LRQLIFGDIEEKKRDLRPP